MSIVTDPSLVLQFINKKKMIVFDFDGVLADSVEVKTEAFAALYEPYGEKIVQKVRQHHRENGGVSRYDKLKYYHKTFLNKPLTLDELESLSYKFSGLVVNKVIAAPEIPASKALLEYCIKAGKYCVINSATPIDELQVILAKRGLSDFFSEVYGSPASKEENLRMLLQRVDYTVEDGVFLGDALTDFEAAQGVNMDFIGVGAYIADMLNSTSGNWHVISNSDFS